MNRIFIQLLIDRTGSMRNRWDETISAINAYVEKLTQAEDVEARIGLAFFDRSPPDPVLQWKPDAERETWTPLSASDREIQPRGMTPLFDAVVEVAAKLRARTPATDERLQLVVMTDGEENSSQEATLETVRKTIASLEENGVPVTFLGAGLGAFRQGAVMGTHSARSAHVGGKGVAASMDTLSEKSLFYGRSGSADSLNYTTEERRKMSEE